MLTYLLLPNLQCIRLILEFISRKILPRSFSWSKIFFIFSLAATSISWNFVLISNLLFSAISSILLTKSIINFCGSFLYKKMGSSIRFEDIETKTGTCFPIQVVNYNSFSSSVGTQIDSKSKIARLLKSSLSSETGRLNHFSFSNKVSRSSYTFFG